MSVNSTTSRNDYVGNNTTDTYSYGFKIFSDEDLRVTKTVDDVEELLVLDTDYTVTGAGSVNGGTIVLDAGDLDTGELLTIRRVREITQQTDIRNAGDTYPETIEDEFDKQTMVAQQQQDEIDRSVKLPESVAASEFDPTLPADILASANRVPTMNATGDGFALVTAWPLAVDIATASASAAAAAASEAAASIAKVAAELAETNAETAETNAELAETNAEAALASALIAQTAAELAETNAEAALAAALVAETNAETAETNAETAETNAETAETNAAASEAAAAASAAAALVSEGNAATSETNAAASEAAAAASAAGATAVGLGVYADDAAFVTANGAAADGDMYYNSTVDQARLYANGSWGSVGGGGLTVVAVQTIAGSGSITNSVTVLREMLHVKGTTTPTTASTTPFGTAGTWVDGSEKVLVGNDDDATLIITANDAANGCVGNFGTLELNKYKTATFIWSASLSRWIFAAGVQ